LPEKCYNPAIFLGCLVSISEAGSPRELTICSFAKGVTMSPGIWILQHAPRPSYIVLGLFFVFVVIPVARRILEGVAYSVAWSGTWGETPLFLVWTLGAVVVDSTPVPEILLNPWVNLGIFLIFVAIGLFLWSRPDGHGTFIDGFHNAVVVPVFGYMTTICMLLFLLTFSLLFLALGVIAIGVWGFFVRKDDKEGSMQQVAHVQKTGVRWIFGTQWIVRIIDAIGIAVLFYIVAEALGSRLVFAFP
jgi:hypothetical protein